MITFSVDSLLYDLVFYEAGLLRCLLITHVAIITFPFEAIDSENIVENSFHLDAQGRVGLVSIFGMCDPGQKFEELDVFEAVVLLFPCDFVDESHLTHTEAESALLIGELHL